MHFTEHTERWSLCVILRENLKKDDQVDPTAAARAYRRQHRTREEHERPELPLKGIQREK